MMCPNSAFSYEPDKDNESYLHEEEEEEED